MNKTYNLWIFIVSFFALLYSFLVSIRENAGSFTRVTVLDATEEYRFYIYLVTALLILLIGGNRAMRKWTGIRIVNRIDKFQFNTPISNERKKLVVSNTAVEILYLTILAVAFWIFAKDYFIVTFTFIILTIDLIINIIMGVSKRKYRIGMTRKAIIQVDREVVAIYFKGLRRITKQNNRLYFEYVNDLVLTLQLDSIP